MSVKYSFISIISLLLSLLAAYNWFSKLVVLGEFDFLYLLFAILGVVGSVSSILKKKISRKLLLEFYGAQLIFIYTASFSFVMNPGISLAMKIKGGNSTAEMLASQPVIAINLLGILLLFLTYKWHVSPSTTSQSSGSAEASR